ncbi:MAG: DNA alkylation repair protein [Bacteroidales bacterium]|nr:DNA alkylation repair protein [Bacteroidales bacterium]
MNTYLHSLSHAFESNAVAENAFFMKKYMKGKFEYFGIKTPIRRDITKKILKSNGFPKAGELENVVRDCWQKPEREYQYFAMDLLVKLMKKADKKRIGLYEFLVMNKSWWDTVDLIAAKLIGTHFRRFPDLITLYPEKWMLSKDMWLQRTAILFQLHYKKETNLDLLTKHIRELQGSKEFFINKAIGWILREYSKTDTDWVIRFVNNNELAPLSKREALKWLERK